MRSGLDAGLESYVPRELLRHVHELPGGMVAELSGSVLSVDIAGFTPLTERMVEAQLGGVDRLSRMLNAFYGDLVTRVEAHGGELVTILGDGMIAVWPAQGVTPLTSAKRAARCGLELCRTFNGYRADSDTVLRVRTGLGSGTLQLARIGSPGRWDLAVAGAAITDAVAADHLAAPGVFVVSPGAWDLLSPEARGRALEAGFFQLTSSRDEGDVIASPSPTHFSDANLLSYLPPAVQTRVASTTPLWQGELRHVSAAFFQLRTRDGHHLDPVRAQEAAGILQLSLERLGGGWEKISFHDKGTVVTAIFGLPPHAHEDDARRAVAAALDARQRLLDIDVVASVGVATGRAFWGPIGSESRRQYCLIGGVMNLACRLMQRADSEVLCCPRTLETLSDRIAGEEIGQHALKGFERPVSVFRAHSTRPAQSRRRHTFGRVEERARLLRALEGARQGQGSLLWIESDPGLGKSSLVAELGSLGPGTGVGVLVATGDSVEQSIPYHAWRGALAVALGVQGDASGSEIATEVVSRVDALPGMAGFASLLSPVLRLPLPDSAKTQLLDGQSRADRTAELILSIFEHAGDSGLAIVLEDLHWFDSASLRLAQLAHKRLPRVAVVATTRPVREAHDPAYALLRSAADLMLLEPLPPDQILEIVAHQLGARGVSDEAGRLLREHAEGNPLFAESLAREFGASGALVVVDGIVRLGSDVLHNEVEIPRSLDAIIGTRVDRLTPTDSLTLKAASAVGRSFGIELLQAVHPSALGESDLRRSLQNLEGQRLIIALETGGGYVFDHAVTHEVAYGRIPSRQRETLHTGIAEWHEQTHAGRLSAHYPTLAHHLERAGHRERACEFLELASDQALRGGAFREAAGFLGRALALSSRQPGPAFTALRVARWHRQLGEALDALGDKQRMGDCARRALLELGRPEPSSTLGQVAFVVRDLLAQTIPQAFKASIGRPASAEVAFELSRACQTLSSHYFFSLKPLGMLLNVLRATNAAEYTAKRSERAKCYSGMALWLGIVGQQRFARRYAARAVAACSEPDDSGVATQALTMAALYYVGTGDFESCVECCAAAQLLADARDDHAWWCNAQAIRLWSRVYRGEHASVAEEVRGLRERAKRADSEHLQAWAARFEGSNALFLGNSVAACTAFHEVLPVVRHHGDHAEELLVQGSLVLALVRSGKLADARAILHETMDLLSRVERPTSHILLEGLSALLEGLHVMTLESRSDPFLLACRDSGLRALSRYARSFPIGAPRYRHFLGLRELDRGQRVRAAVTFSRGFRAAERLGLPMDQNLLSSDLKRASEPPARLE